MRKTVLSAGVVVLRWEGDSCRYLLLRAYRNWDFPKGIVEPDEDPLWAACREAEEETSLRALDFRWGPQYVETGPYGRGKVARYYVAETCEVSVRLPVSPMLGRPEHHEYRWVTFEEARGLLSSRMLSVLDWAAGVTGCDRRK